MYKGACMCIRWSPGMYVCKVYVGSVGHVCVGSVGWGMYM